MDFNSIEVKKLIEFAYYLHEKDMEYYSKYDCKSNCSKVQFVPMMEEVSMGGLVKKLDNGMVSGCHTKEYGHGSAIPSLILDVVVGEYIQDGFIYDTAIRFHLDGSLNNEDILERKLYFLMLKPDFSDCIQDSFPIIRGKKKKSMFDFDRNIPTLVIDGGYDEFCICDNVWDNMSEDKKLTIFVKVMETLGFRRDDVVALLEGKKTSEEVFMAVAPPEIAHKRVLFYNQRKYTFENNVLVNVKPLDVEVSADIGICLDDLPFPFLGPAIIDASLVNTYGVDFGENARGHKLINVNSNLNAICCAKLKNAIIDEVIDLAKVDATNTEFGHHVIINLDYSIGRLEDTEFLYAKDQNGRRFDVDLYGRLNIGIDGNLKKTIIEQNDDIRRNIDVLADASDYKLVQEAMVNDADGIGLIRTEDMLSKDGVPIYKSIFIANDDKQRNENINECARIERAELEKILNIARGKRVVIRLLDAKLGEMLTEEQINNYFFSEQELRGDAALMKYPKLLEMQAKVILESALKTKNSVDILVPINYDLNSIRYVRKIFQKVADEIGYYNFRIGAMVEYVWFANRIDYIANYADFIAIGLNDLTEDVKQLSRNSHDKCFAILDERVKQLVKESIYRARIANSNISIGLCGMHTNFAENLDFFQEVGVNYITCNPQFIPTAKRLLMDVAKRDEQLKLCLKLKKD